MRHLLWALLLIPFVAFADARLELDTGTCHAPWNEADADQEYKFSCKIWSVQNANGTYNAYSETVFPLVVGESVKGMEEYDNGGRQIIINDCGTTAGVFQDDNGTEFTTNNCEVVLYYTRTRYSWRHEVTSRIRLRQAAAVETQTEGALLRSLDGVPTLPVPVPAGVSKAVRY